MTIHLGKGDGIELARGDSKLERFCVGCSWGSIVERQDGFLGWSSKGEVSPVDLDLSVAMTDKLGNLVDHIYSPEYREDFLARYNLPPGKMASRDQALRHSGDDRAGEETPQDNLDNEIVTVDLARVDPEISQIFFFLNNVGEEDFSQIPRVSIRMYEGTPTEVKEVFASYDVTTQAECRGKRALVMGKLYRSGNEWKFMALGDAAEDRNICETILRIGRSRA